jgi:uncharacterized membrane protein
MSTKKSFSIYEVFSQGFDTYRQNWQFFFLISLIMIFVTLLGENVKDSFVLELSFWLLNSVLWIGFMTVCFRLVAKKSVELVALIGDIGKLPSYIIASILYGLAIGVGFILLIIPGIILSARLQLYIYYIVDKNQGPIEALKSSWNATRGHTLNLIGALIVAIIINIAGAIALGVGLFVTYPATVLAGVYIYKKLA